MQVFVDATGFGLFGYLCGSLPFAIWITRLVKGVDVREAGSGHATTANTIRQVGILPRGAGLLAGCGQRLRPHLAGAALDPGGLDRPR